MDAKVEVKTEPSQETPKSDTGSTQNEIKAEKSEPVGDEKPAEKDPLLDAFYSEVRHFSISRLKPAKSKQPSFTDRYNQNRGL